MQNVHIITVYTHVRACFTYIQHRVVIRDSRSLVNLSRWVVGDMMDLEVRIIPLDPGFGSKESNDFTSPNRVCNQNRCFGADIDRIPHLSRGYEDRHRISPYTTSDSRIERGIERIARHRAPTTNECTAFLCCECSVSLRVQHRALYAHVCAVTMNRDQGSELFQFIVRVVGGRRESRMVRPHTHTAGSLVHARVWDVACWSAVRSTECPQLWVPCCAAVVYVLWLLHSGPPGGTPGRGPERVRWVPVPCRLR